MHDQGGDSVAALLPSRREQNSVQPASAVPPASRGRVDKDRTPDHRGQSDRPWSPLLHGGKSVRCNRRRAMMNTGAPAHAAENEKVEKVHAAEHDEHHSNLARQSFNSLLGRPDLIAKLEGQAYIAKVNEVKPDDQEVVNRIRQRLVPVKHIHQKNPAVFVQRLGHPDGQGDADGQVNQVSRDSYRHGVPPLTHLNTFNYEYPTLKVPPCQDFFERVRKAPACTIRETF